MAKISTVDYEAIPNQASQMRSQGEELNAELTSAYESIDNMRSSWYGVRYNKLVSSFNEMVETINEMLQLVVTDIPCALENVANNYASADTGDTICSPNEDGPSKVTDIAESTEVGMRFLTSEVENVQTNVENNFANAVDQMNSIESTFNSITWESEAADAFRDKFTTLKESIVESFDNIKTEFSELMTQAEEDVESAETANTVS